MKVIIAGGRNFRDRKLLYSKCDTILSSSADIEIVSGMAEGADSIGELYAMDRGYQVKQFPADWKKHGNSAGPIRNHAMACYADACIVFWDGKSRGTQDMIARALEQKLKLRIIRY